MYSRGTRDEQQRYSRDPIPNGEYIISKGLSVVLTEASETYEFEGDNSRPNNERTHRLVALLQSSEIDELSDNVDLNPRLPCGQKLLISAAGLSTHCKAWLVVDPQLKTVVVSQLLSFPTSRYKQ